MCCRGAPMDTTWNPKHVQNVNMDSKSEAGTLFGSGLDSGPPPGTLQSGILLTGTTHRAYSLVRRRIIVHVLFGPEMITHVVPEHKITSGTSSQSGSTFQCKIFDSICQKRCQNGVTITGSILMFSGPWGRMGPWSSPGAP